MEQAEALEAVDSREQSPTGSLKVSRGPIASYCRWLTRKLLKHVSMKDLLEKVDDESLQYSLINASARPIQCCPMILRALPIVMALVVFGYGNVFFVLGFATSLLILHVFTYGIVRFTISRLAASVMGLKKAQAVLREREVVSFSLGLSASSALAQYRLEVFLAVRRMVVAISTASEKLVKYRKIRHEKDHLIRLFYSEEMKSLMSDHVERDSPHVSERGISTMIDLSTLHVSELCRLLLLRLFNTSTVFDVALFLKHCFRILQKLRVGRSELRALAIPRRSIYVPEALAKIKVERLNGLQKVEFALRDIVAGISDESLNVVDVQRALQRVMTMDVFPRHQKKDSEKAAERREEEEKNTVEVKEHKNVPLAPPPIDQVFETVVEKEDRFQESDYDVVDLDEIKCGRGLMEELRGVLSGRADEFAAREKKALAEFYGVTEEELEAKWKEEQEREEKERLARLQAEASELEAMGACSGDAEWRSSERARIQPSLNLELAAALSGMRKREVVLGDSDSESE